MENFVSNEVWEIYRQISPVSKVQIEAHQIAFCTQHFRLSTIVRTKYYKDILYQLAELDSREFISKGQHCTSAYLKTIHLCLNKHVHLGQSQQRHIGQKRQHKEEIKQGKEKNVIYPQNEDGNRCESSKRGKITLSISIEDRFGAAYL